MVVTWSFALFFLLISPAVGSFLGVLVERLPQRRSILTPSKCNTCGTGLRWAEMIPILSAIALKNQCASCGASIPNHLIRIEIAAIFVAFGALVIAESQIHFVAILLCLWCLVALFYADLFFMRLPDPLTGALFIFAIIAAWVSPNMTVVSSILSGFGALVAFALVRWAYFLVRNQEGMGMGDVKLAAGLGALLGWQLIPVAVLAAALLALAVAAIDFLRGAARPGAQDAIPFGSYLTGAALLLLLL